MHGQHGIYITSDAFHPVAIQVGPSKSGKSGNGLDLVFYQVCLVHHSTGARLSPINSLTLRSSANRHGQWIWLKGGRREVGHTSKPDWQLSIYQNCLDFLLSFFKSDLRAKSCAHGDEQSLQRTTNILDPNHTNLKMEGKEDKRTNSTIHGKFNNPQLVVGPNLVILQ